MWKFIAIAAVVFGVYVIMHPPGHSQAYLTQLDQKAELLPVAAPPGTPMSKVRPD